MIVVIFAKEYSSGGLIQTNTLMPTPGEKARQKIDEMLVNAGWVVRHYKHVNISPNNNLKFTNQFVMKRLAGNATKAVKASRILTPLEYFSVEAA